MNEMRGSGTLAPVSCEGKVRGGREARRWDVERCFASVSQGHKGEGKVTTGGVFPLG